MLKVTVVEPRAVFEGRLLRPHEDAWLFVSWKGPGRTVVPPIGVELRLEDARPAKGPKPVDAFGVVVWDTRIPPEAWGRHLWLQAAQAGLVTNVTGGTPAP